MSHHPQASVRSSADWRALVAQIRDWARELGFEKLGIADVDLSDAEPRLAAWVAKGYHGDMDYMVRHGAKRTRPADLVPGTVRVLSLRMRYWPAAADAQAVLQQPTTAYISRYALGRDYHKVLRGRLQTLAERIAAAAQGSRYRVFTDSAPVMEVELATKAGLGWRGKHTLLLDRDAGSYFFLGDIYTDLPLPVDVAQTAHCGSCTKCIEVCPTRAIVAPYELDARRCISYLTIEHKGAIPEELRPLLGNRIYGCDDCQLVCPWNRYARLSEVPDFAVRHGLDAATLVELFNWTATDFATKLAGSAIRRIGHERWLRNLAVALGNALRAVPDRASSRPIAAALTARLDHPSSLVREHVAWALAQGPH